LAKGKRKKTKIVVKKKGLEKTSNVPKKSSRGRKDLGNGDVMGKQGQPFLGGGGERKGEKGVLPNRGRVCRMEDKRAGGN